MSHASLLSGKILLLCGILGIAGCTNETHVVQYSKSFTVSGHAAVQVSAFDAQIRVLTSDNPTVEFRVQYEVPDEAGAQPSITARQDGDAVQLTANEGTHHWHWGFFRAPHGTIEVLMPKNADLRLETSNGAVEVTRLNGDISLRSSNGALVLNHVSGKVRAHSSNGAISVDDLDGDCELATSNGRIEASGRFDALDIHSSNGHIAARAAAGSKLSSNWRIGTSNSAIELTVPTDLKANLDVGTSNGGIQVDLPLTVQGAQNSSHLHGALNGGGPQVLVHTSNGHIRISENRATQT
jgi:hypothetical protein